MTSTNLAVKPSTVGTCKFAMLSSGAFLRVMRGSWVQFRLHPGSFFFQANCNHTFHSFINLQFSISVIFLYILIGSFLACADRN